MKIAILYGGRISNYDTYYNNLQKYIVKEHEVDYFLSHSKELNEDLSGFIELYKPKIVIDENIDYDPSQTPNYSVMCMFYNRHRLFQSFKKYCQDNAANYDIIMVYRLDVLALSEINLNQMNTFDNVLYVPNIRHSQGINDFMAIGNFVAIEKYCNLFDHYRKLLYISNNSSSAELLLIIYLQTMSMQIYLFPYNCVLRDSLWENGGKTIRISSQELEKMVISNG
jgi:hypothetical protein